MSLNALYGRDGDLLKRALEALLNDFAVRARSATTEEERMAIEGAMIQHFISLLDPIELVGDLAAGDTPLLDDLARDLDWVYDRHRMSRIRLQLLAERFVDYHNSREVALADLNARVKRIRQKRAALGLWESDYSFVLVEHFYNQDWLSQDFTSLTANSIVDAQGSMTLPVSEENAVVVKSVGIATGSNGSPGNSNVEVDLSTQNPNNIVDGDSGTWFEYERLDSGPCELNLKIQLHQPQIINMLDLEAVNLGFGYDFEVVDVHFTASGEESKSLRGLLQKSLEKDFWAVGSAKNGGWSVVFLPVYTQTIILKLRQRSPTLVETATADNRVVTRERYAIAIKKLELRQRKYLAEGSMGSVGRMLPSNVYVGEPDVMVYPPRQSLYKMILETSLDGGATWVTSETWGGGERDTFLVESSDSLMWRATLRRDDAAFSKLKEFEATTTQVKKVNALLRSVSRFRSPAVLSLTEKPNLDDVVVMQTQLGRRGDRYKTVYLGQGTGTDISFDLPVDLLYEVEPEEIDVYVNGKEYTYTADNTALGAGLWAFSDDFKRIEFDSTLGEGSVVRIGFGRERMLFSQRADGFVHETAMPFDPDKKNIKIRALPRNGERASYLVPRHKKVIRLPHRLIEANSFYLQSANGTSYSERPSRTSVLSTTNGYFVNYAEGIIWFNSTTGDDQVRLSYVHHTPKVLSEKEYDVLYDGLKPIGLLVKQEALSAADVTEVLNGAAVKRYDPVSESYVVKGSPFTGTTTDAVSLDFDYLIEGAFVAPDDLLQNGLEPKEVEYIDGKTEFLGLIPMNNEVTTEIAPTAGLVQFTLGAGALVHYGYDVIFSDTSLFATKSATPITGVGAPNVYYIDEATGVVSLRTTTDMPAGIEISYYYRNPEFLPDNKFSVDYKNGYLYSYADLNFSATVKYKATAYTVEYDIAKEITDATYNSSSNTVSIRTESLNAMNTLVKVFWEEESDKPDLQQYRDYFSPLVQRIAYRFN